MAEFTFCEKMERMGVRCRPCYDELCTMRGREQALYAGHQIHDTVTIHGIFGGFLVESDIEIPYQTKYPFPRETGKLAEFLEEGRHKEIILTMVISPRLPRGVSDPRYHHHYRPNVMPEIVAIHVHVSYRTTDLVDAREKARRIQEAIDPERLIKLIK